LAISSEKWEALLANAELRNELLTCLEKKGLLVIGLFFFVVNKKWWEKMDTDTHDPLAGIIAENMAKAREASKQLTIEGDAALKEKGLTVTKLAPAEMTKFKEKQMKVWDQFEGDIGKEWLDKIKALTASMN
jgi:TRAP-type C4-dicarboxylate transport system substrate-binding protein